MNIKSFEEFRNLNWLNANTRTNMYFFVVDNTEWPEALDTEPWGQVEDRNTAQAKNLKISVDYKVIYSSNDKFYSWTYIFMLLLIMFGSLLVITICCFCHKRYMYAYYSRERK